MAVGPLAELRAHRIPILGGEFGGVYFASEPHEALTKDPSFEVTLVNRVIFFLSTPILHRIAASDLRFTDFVNPIRELLKKVEFFHGEVESIEPRRVSVVDGLNRIPTQSTQEGHHYGLD